MLYMNAECFAADSNYIINIKSNKVQSCIIILHQTALLIRRVYYFIDFEELPDLVLNATLLETSAFIDRIEVNSLSCALIERCVSPSANLNTSGG